MEACLFNTCSNNVAAYCKHHHCGMTVKQMKCKNCLGKQCWYLQKNEEHPYWKQREVAKQKRKNRKKAIEEYVAQF
jgi:hypothetical protein